MITDKYRISNMAKDLGVKSKEICDILAEVGMTGRTHMAVLEPDEYAYVLNKLSLTKQVEAIDTYIHGEAALAADDEPRRAPKAEKSAKEEKAAKADKEESAEAEAPENAGEKTRSALPNSAETPAAEASAQSAAAEDGAAKAAEESAADAAEKGEEKPAEKKVDDEQKKLREATSRAAQREIDEVAAKIAERKAAAAQRLAENARKAAAEVRAKAAAAAANAAKKEKEGAGKLQQDGRNAQGGRNAQQPKGADSRRDVPYREAAASKAEEAPKTEASAAAVPNRVSTPVAPKAPKQTRQQKKQPQQARPQQQTLERTAVGDIESGKVVERSQKANTRVVDTRTSSVDLSRYDDKRTNYGDDVHETVSDRKKIKKQNSHDRDGSKEKERLAMEKLRKQELEKARKQQLSITVPDTIVVSELASRLKVTAAEVVKKLMMLGVMANVNQTIDFDTAFLIGEELGAKVTKEVVVTIEEKLFDESEDSDDSLVTRAPVVCVMGHVDHGKTSLLDRIRHSNVTAGEAGGITQAIGAYRVNIDGKDITFLDTPGHEAFTSMRARGAKATDIAVLVVAADDGIMPQTIEAINHAKAAELQIIVAINKMDKPDANPDVVKQELTQYELVPEEWGGDVMCVPVSALTGQGIDELLEDILLIAEVQDYKANPDRRGKGIVIESRLDKGRGPVATVLVQNGTLHAGDVVIAGTAVGRIRVMTDENGRSVRAAGPSVPVEIVGLSDVPSAGDECIAVEDERMARELAEQRREKAKEDTFKANANVNLDDLFAQISDGFKELNIIIKADVAGSAEAVKASLLKLSNDEVKVKVIHTAVGGITESDVTLAAVSNAIVIGFNVRPDKNAIDSAERQKVDVRTYRIIYECIEEVEAALKGMLAPTFKESLLGHSEVRQTIHVPGVGTIAGSYVQDGKITRNAQIRVVRDGIVIFEDKISSLRRFKDDVREVAQGYECGIGLDRFNDIKVGDILEAFEMVEVSR